MVVGTTILKLDGNPYFTPEFGRGGLAATFAIDVTHFTAGDPVTFQVEHRNADDQTFVAVGPAKTVSAVVTDQWDVSGLKEILRIAISFDAADPATDGLHVLIQPPSWRPY